MVAARARVVVVLTGTATDIFIKGPSTEPGEAERLLDLIGARQRRAMEEPASDRFLDLDWLKVPNVTMIRAAFLEVVEDQGSEAR